MFEPRLLQEVLAHAPLPSVAITKELCARHEEDAPAMEGSTGLIIIDDGSKRSEGLVPTKVQIGKPCVRGLRVVLAAQTPPFARSGRPGTLATISRVCPTPAADRMKLGAHS